MPSGLVTVTLTAMCAGTIADSAAPFIATSLFALLKTVAGAGTPSIRTTEPASNPEPVTTSRNGLDAFFTAAITGPLTVTPTLLVQATPRESNPSSRTE